MEGAIGMPNSSTGYVQLAEERDSTKCNGSYSSRYTGKEDRGTNGARDETTQDETMRKLAVACYSPSEDKFGIRAVKEVLSVDGRR